MIKRITFTGITPFLFSTGLALLMAFFPFSGLALSLPTKMQDGLTIFFGIVIEALPFVVLGISVSLLIQRFATTERVQKLMPNNPVLALPAMALLGMLFPVCECGNQPVARQLMRQGVRPAYAITFLLGAPILNPVVMISTYVAFRFSPWLVVARFVLGFLVAVAVGLYFLVRGDGDVAKVSVQDSQDEQCHTDHGPTNHFVTELLEMLAALSIGAIIAAVVQVYVPRNVLLELGSTPIAAILVMMSLALIVSLCSTVDAFFALSFSSTFSQASILSFLVFGPMVDFRAISLLSRSFTSRAIVTMSLLVAQLVFLASLGLHHGGIL